MSQNHFVDHLHRKAAMCRKAAEVMVDREAARKLMALAATYDRSAESAAKESPRVVGAAAAGPVRRSAAKH